MNIVTVLVAHITILGYAYCDNGTITNNVLEVTPSSNTYVATNTTKNNLGSEVSTATNDNERHNLTLTDLINLRNDNERHNLTLTDLINLRNDNERHNLTLTDLINFRNLNRTSIPRNNRTSVGSFTFQKTNNTLANNFFIGNATGLRRVHREDVYSEAIPLMTREFFFNYEHPETKEIKAIKCFDYRRSEAVVDLVDGGVGFPYATIVLTSQESHGLYFGIEIFA